MMTPEALFEAVWNRRDDFEPARRMGFDFLIGSGDDEVLHALGGLDELPLVLARGDHVRERRHNEDEGAENDVNIRKLETLFRRVAGGLFPRRGRLRGVRHDGNSFERMEAVVERRPFVMPSILSKSPAKLSAHRRQSMVFSRHALSRPHKKSVRSHGPVTTPPTGRRRRARAASPPSKSTSPEKPLPRAFRALTGFDGLFRRHRRGRFPIVSSDTRPTIRARNAVMLCRKALRGKPRSCRPETRSAVERRNKQPNE